MHLTVGMIYVNKNVLHIEYRSPVLFKEEKHVLYLYIPE